MSITATGLLAQRCFSHLKFSFIMKGKLRLFLQLSFLQLTGLAGTSDLLAATSPADVSHKESARMWSADRKVSGKITDDNGLLGIPVVSAPVLFPQITSLFPENSLPHLPLRMNLPGELSSSYFSSLRLRTYAELLK